VDEIILDMLVLAWYPHIYFRLSFGSQDQIAKELDKVAPRIILQEQSVKPWDKSAIRKLIAAISSDWETSGCYRNRIESLTIRVEAQACPGEWC
jgi:hypothetical protein